MPEKSSAARPDRHKNKLVVGVRNSSQELRDAARGAAIAAGYTGGLSQITVAFWRWYAGEPGAQLPERPVQ